MENAKGQPDAARLIFATAQKMVDVLDASELPDGPLKAAAIKVLAITYNMEARAQKE